MFKCIVFATDGSAHSQKAQAYARDFTKLHNSQLFVVHAYAGVSDLLGYQEYDNAVSRRIADGQKILDKAVAPLESAGLKVHAELLEGPMAEAILREAETRGADLIILGRAGKEACGVSCWAA